MAAALLAPRAAFASPPHAAIFAGRTITFDRVVDEPGGEAIAIDDAGLRAFLSAVAATVTWQAGQRYILFNTAEPQVVNFALGDKQYDVGPVTEAAPFAPFLLDGHAYVPFDALMHALGFAVVASGGHEYLQPQLTALDVQNSGDSVRLVARAGMPVDGRIVSNENGKIVLAFADTGSVLPLARTVDGAIVKRIDVRTDGTAQHPRTIVTLVTAPGQRATPGTDDQRDFTLDFGAQTSQSAGPPAAAASAASSALIRVTSVAVTNDNGATTVRISLDGPASYDWHRLRPPDNRIWIDIHNARLGMPPQDDPVRVHQQNPQTVRIALSPSAYQTIDVEPDSEGLSMIVGPQLADEGMPRSGSGTAGSPDAAAIAQQSPAPDDTWRFSPRAAPSPQPTYVAANPHLIVIDPGHGGDDPGSLGGDLVEKTITLDISRRLRDILTKRGWTVRMTRDGDTAADPGADDDGELQARDDVANKNGARLFLSIHVNSFVNAGPHGATTYFYKPEDYAFAQALRRRIAQEVDVKDDGIVKDKLYVLHHADMPAALVETAFISNPDDRALLASPQWREKMAKAIADGIGDYAGDP